jgi:hypothetical protein
MPEQITWKIYRAKQHYDELHRELHDYFTSNPGKMVVREVDSSGVSEYEFVTKEPIPARFGLIAGDFLQNLRSSLDYLVWQLVLANGENPGQCNAFPICESPDGWEKSIGKSNRMRGVHPGAVDLIKSLQPCFSRMTPVPLPLTVLEKLTNENKHRQVLMTSLSSVLTPDVITPIAYAEYEVSRMRNGESIPGERFIAFIVFQSQIVRRLEILSALNVVSNFVGFEVFPKFEKFFA